MFLFPIKLDRMNFEPIQRQELQKTHFCNTIYKSFALLFRHLGFYMQAPHAIGIRQQSVYYVYGCMFLHTVHLRVGFLSQIKSLLHNGMHEHSDIVLFKIRIDMLSSIRPFYHFFTLRVSQGLVIRLFVIILNFFRIATDSQHKLGCWKK